MFLISDDDNAFFCMWNVSHCHISFSTVFESAISVKYVIDRLFRVGHCAIQYVGKAIASCTVCNQNKEGHTNSDTNNKVKLANLQEKTK